MKTNEVRLIDANALFNVFESIGWFNNADRELAENLILDATTIDAAQVVHARWIEMKTAGKRYAWKCSACGHWDNSTVVPGNYCWQCGAKMEGK